MDQSPAPIVIRFDQGTLLIEADRDSTAIEAISSRIRYDVRVSAFRAPAMEYAPIVLAFRRNGIPYVDEARRYAPVAFRMRSPIVPKPHQRTALDAWTASGGRGIVVLPTGSGKSFLAMLAMERIGRPVLVVVPTIDLMQQWATGLERTFGVRAGMLGGGSSEVLDMTVSTYDSAVLRMEFIGNRFGLVVFDECHHLPGRVNRTAASMCLAPYRLGLTATPERDDDGDAILERSIGPLVYRIDIPDLEGDMLAPYQIRRILLPLASEEETAYRKNRDVYTGFLRDNGITFRTRQDWPRFLALCSRSSEGRRAFRAYLEQKRIARCGSAKRTKVWELLRLHRSERVLIFTADNETAYELGNRFLLPVITHKTKVAERKFFLDGFRNGTFPFLVTSKVLNEGIDVPEASVGIVMSGSGSIREHVQRLGRVLRGVEGKRAVLYELISDGTSEYGISERRRRHRAYQRSVAIS